MVRQRLSTERLALAGLALFLASCGKRADPNPADPGQDQPPPPLPVAPFEEPRRVIDRQDIAGEIVLDETHAYWLNGLSVMRFPKAGGKASYVGTLPTGACGIAVDAVNIYCTLCSSPGQGVEAVPYAGQGVIAMAKADGATRIVAPDQRLPSSIVADGTSVYWRNIVELGRQQRGEIVKTNVKGGLPQILAHGVDAKGSLAQDSANLYWTNGFARTVSMVPKTGGQVTILGTDEKEDDLLGPSGLAVDDTHVYWSSPKGLKRVPKQGGKVDVIVSSGNVSLDANPALDALAVYWADAGVAMAPERPYENLRTQRAGEGIMMRLKTGGPTMARLLELDGSVSIAVDQAGMFVAAGGTVYQLKRATSGEAPKPTLPN